ERFSRHFLTIAASIVQNPHIRLGEIDMLLPEETQQILAGFNDTAVSYPLDKTLHQLFEEQVDKTPDQAALLFSGQSLTYRELNERANRLARVLRAKGVGPDRLVAIMAERSPEMVIGILGILKAGGAYVPVDPGYPQERIQYLLEDSNAALLLSQAHLLPLLAQVSDELPECLDLNAELDAGLSGSNLPAVNQPTDLAYVIYTSGTTGKPKGVMIPHQGIVNCLQWRRDEYGFGPTDKALQVFSFAFDGFVASLFAPLLGGATCVLPQEAAAKDPVALKKLMAATEVTHYYGVPSLFQAILDCSTTTDFNQLRCVTLGGEKLPVQLVQKTKEKHPAIEINNEYGPTENSVVTTISRSIEAGQAITIGRPLANVQVYIVDEQHHLQPVGVVGELCIGGAGLARGYLNKPELTAEKFVANPFRPGERMYKTGDLGRWLHDGTIDFIGRVDDQIKVRGYRIEVGEIEAVLLAYDQTNEAVVVAYQDDRGDSYLAAYVTGKAAIEESELRAHLLRELPAYMVPTYLIQLDALPLTPNGKVDRKALPKPEGKPATGAAYVAPATEVEAKLVAIWENALGISGVGVLDHFFELGGHSLKAMTVVAQVHREFQIDLLLKQFFAAPTIRDLARLIEHSEQAADAAIQPAEPQAYYPVSSAQQRMYLLHQLEGAGISYNTPGIIMLEGKLDRERLANALQALVDRHDILRTSFEMVGDELVQKIHDRVAVNMEYVTAEEQQIDDLFHAFVRPFDLSVPPLLRMSLVKLADERHLLLYDMHHIAADAASITILFDELAELYQGRELPEMRIQYKDFAVWQKALHESDAFKQQEAYWLRTFAGNITAVDVPTDFPRPAVKSFAGGQVTLSMDQELLGALHELAAHTNTTLFMVLLAAYNVLLAKYAGQDDIIVGTPISGRSRAELAPVVGMFVHTLAIRNKPTAEKTFKQFLQEVKQNALDAFDHQDYPFESLVEKLGIPRDPGRNPLFDTMFILQNDELHAKTLDQLVYRPYESDSALDVAKFDLSFHLTERETDLFLRLEYCTKLFKQQTVERMAHHFLQILRAVTANPENELQEIEMLTAAEKQMLLVAFNDTHREYRADQTNQQLFEELAEKMPEHTALVFEEKRMSFRELNERANQLAAVLREKGVGPAQIVALLVERSAEMVIATLATLKAGGAFLP
ncbi:amino acid adenylation domain-containing protein, partial [Mesorhizobium sp. M00.F.Ca.ET.186.01.1.1]